MSVTHTGCALATVPGLQHSLKPVPQVSPAHWRNLHNEPGVYTQDHALLQPLCACILQSVSPIVTEGDGPGISGCVPTPGQEGARLAMLNFPQHPPCWDSALWLQAPVAHGWEQLIPAAAGLQPLAPTTAAPGAATSRVLLWCPPPWAGVPPWCPPPQPLQDPIAAG